MILSTPEPSSPAAFPAPYRLCLFGGLRITDPIGAVLPPFRTRKAEWLLAYLALNPHRKHTREEIIDRFWQDLSPDAARDNLSTSLSTLRRYLNPPRDADEERRVVCANRDALWLNLHTVKIDVTEFEQLLDSVDTTSDSTERCRRLRAAVALYTGPLLNGIYEEWMLGAQTRLAERYVFALLALADAQFKTGSGETALSTASRAQQADPLNEDTYTLRMQILASLGQVEAARKVYQELCAHLKRELGCNPSVRSQVIHESLDQIAAQGRALDAPSDPVPTTAGSASIDFAPDIADYLSAPTAMTRLFGRDSELHDLTQLLTAPDGPRLITITGTGGIGKTRVAQTVAEQVLAPAFSLAKCWVALAEVPDFPQVIPALARIVAPSADTNDPVEAICRALALPSATIAPNRRTLLVLDNAEHLLPHPGSATGTGRTASFLSLVRLLLNRVPHLTLLVTSRRALGLYGEQEYSLSPLTEECAAELFYDRAKLVHSSLDPQAENAAVREIVRRIDGFPLAIEMIAGWSRTLTPTQILKRLSSSANGGALPLLVHAAHDVPARHRSIRQTLLWSLDMLPDTTRRAFAALSVFHGGWTMESAEAVLGGDAATALQQLAEHSLVTQGMSLQTAPGSGRKRLRFLQPIRELARELVGEWALEERECLRDRHATHFAEQIRAFYRQFAQGISEHEQFRCEENNFRAAIHHLLERERQSAHDLAKPALLPGEVLGKTLHLYLFLLWWDGAMREGWELAHHVADTVPSLPAAWRARLLDCVIYCAWRLHLAHEVPALLDRVEALIADENDRAWLSSLRVQRAHSHNALGQSERGVSLLEGLPSEFPDIYTEGSPTHFQLLQTIAAFLCAGDDLPRARAATERVLAIGRATNNRDGLWTATLNLAKCLLRQREFASALARAHDAIPLVQSEEAIDNITTTLVIVAAIRIELGDYEKAARLLAATSAFALTTGAVQRGLPVSVWHTLEYQHSSVDPDWRRLLAPDVRERCEHEGSQMTRDEAVRYALEDT